SSPWLPRLVLHDARPIFEHLGPQRLVPLLAAQPFDQFAEDPVADVGVVELLPGAELELLGRQALRQLVPAASWAAFPPRPRGLRRDATGVGQQLRDGQVPER